MGKSGLGRIIILMGTNIDLGAGTEKSAFFYSKLLPELGWDVTILMTDYLDHKRTTFSENLSNIRVFKIKSYGSRFNFLNRIPKIGNILFQLVQYVTILYSSNIIRKEFTGHNRYDIVYAIYNPFSLYFEKGTLIVGSEHTLVAGNTDSLLGRFTLLYHKITLRRIKYFHAFSLKSLQDKYLSKPVFIVPCGVDCAVFKPSSDTGYRPIRFLFYARLVPGKGFRTALEAWHLLQINGISNCEFHIAGEGELSYLLNQSTERGSVVYHGSLDELNLAELVRSCDVFVYPSVSDNFGLVIVEALASGLHIITTDYFRGIFDEEEKMGFLEYIKRDPTLFKESMRRSIANVETIRKMKSLVAKYTSEKYDWNKVVGELSKQLIRILNSNKNTNNF